MDPSVNEANRVAQGQVIEVADTPSKIPSNGHPIASGQMLIAQSKASIGGTTQSGAGSPMLMRNNAKHGSNILV